MNIITVWWTANDGGPGQYLYSKAYPDSLRHQLAERGYDLTILTDTEYGRPLICPTRYRGWWAKLEVFRPENRDLRPCLCIDLDTFVLGDINPILDLDPERLWMLRNFFRPDLDRLADSGLFIAPKYGVSDDIWRRAEGLCSFQRGDGDFLRQFRHSFIQDFVDGILSYKADHLQESPKKARIVCFHGRPRPEHTEGWAKEFWESHVRSNR